MIKSAAITKIKTISPWQKVRLEKRKVRKQQAIERKLIKQVHPSPIGQSIEVYQEVIKEPIKEVTREEMVQQADKIGLVIDKRWKDSTLLNRINETMGV
jgi:hypothetical protein|tara:strand:+ start:383 stop:679 length:297 start_codon:yes stop_codon:yes gene_type:complete